MTDVLVIGAGRAGVLAVLRAVDLGAQTALVTSGAFAGIVANGPVPIRILAHAGRLMRVDDLARIPLSYRPTRAFWLVSPSRQHTNLASRSAGKHTRRHKQFGKF